MTLLNTAIPRILREDIWISTTMGTLITIFPEPREPRVGMIPFNSLSHRLSPSGAVVDNLSAHTQHHIHSLPDATILWPFDQDCEFALWPLSTDLKPMGRETGSGCVNCDRFFKLEVECRKRGEIIGTSVIPPNKVKELLPPKNTSAQQE